MRNNKIDCNHFSLKNEIPLIATNTISLAGIADDCTDIRNAQFKAITFKLMRF